MHLPMEQEHDVCFSAVNNKGFVFGLMNSDTIAYASIKAFFSKLVLLQLLVQSS